MDFLSGKSKNFLLRKFFKRSWGNDRDLPDVARQSFNKLWKENNPNN
jgi:L-lactate dehydrogenase complex protein LldF